MSPQRTLPRDPGRFDRRHAARPAEDRYRRVPGNRLQALLLPSAFPADELSSTWRAYAACADLPIAAQADFFPGTGVLGRLATKRAQATCRSCPVIERCLDYALRTSDEPWGILGGQSARVLRRWRRELRP